jgi:polyribonucleotide nucleotidyltransferase
MFDIQREELIWGGRKLVLETGKIARQADGAVLATYGETVVLATIVSAKEPKPGFDFFPLTVNYQEKTFAAGRIPGGYFKREGRPTEKETLVSRLIDRPIRPLFVEGYRNETQVVCTVLQHDLENDPDIVAMVAAPLRSPCRACRSPARSALPASAISTVPTSSTRWSTRSRNRRSTSSSPARPTPC